MKSPCCWVSFSSLICFLFYIASYASLLYIEIFLMQRPKRPLRNNEHCHQVANIFRRSYRSGHLTDFIPSAVADVVTRGGTTSCEHVTALPPFQMMEDAEEELEFAQNAARYQLQWTEKISAQGLLYDQTPILKAEESIRQPSIHSMMAIEHIEHIEPSKEPKFNIWSDPYFLDRLQDFVMGDPAQGRYIPSTEAFFER